MIYLTDNDIENMGISPAQCVDWVRESFEAKADCLLPKKIPVHPQGDDFITTMPVLLPKGIDRFVVKVVSRIEGRTPALRSALTMYDAIGGEAMALMDSNWITNMRTGAVAALAIQTLRRPGAHTYAFIGLGQIARAVMKCVAATSADESLTIRLLRYKDQAERFAEEFSHYSNLHFEIVDDVEHLFDGADVIVSAITSAKGLMTENTDLFKPGVLLVPVHTRGFQNCDTIFDGIVGDDYLHIKDFQYFDRFRRFEELADVLTGKTPGRRSDDERIIAYNYGLALHDAWFADKIYNLSQHTDAI